MVGICFRGADGRDYEIDAEPGRSLMAAAVRNRVPGIEAACGGSLVCGTCHAYIAEKWLAMLPAQSETEREMLEYGVHVQANSRLTCQIVVGEAMEGMNVHCPPSQR